MIVLALQGAMCVLLLVFMAFVMQNGINDEGAQMSMQLFMFMLFFGIVYTIFDKVAI